jgi:serine/threonine protein kinase/tetratricopeptide (TPR) repeat protein
MSEPASTTSSTFAERYAVERELGRGGMATVYLARDRRYDRKVAVKVLNPDVSQALGAERFQREIAITAKLTHPNILPLHDSGETDGNLFYVMPFVAGESLRDRLTRERQLPVVDAVCIARGVVAALEHAHAHGIIHRDIKPENILLADGQAVVADFGIARALAANSDERLTSTGVSIGTPAYMSPEQASGESVDGRADIYSVGCMLYEMLAGEPPFTGPTTQAVIAKRFAMLAPDIRLARDTVSDSLADTVARSLARVPADRIQTAAELHALLDEAERLCAKPSGRTGIRTRGRAAHTSPSRRIIVVAASTLIAAIIVTAIAVPPIRHRVARAFGRSTDIHTLAVLPLANLSRDMSQDFFADGLTDALITGLSQLGSINVISRTSVMQYKMMKKSLPAIARELHADAILEGSVARSGDNVRISEKLIRVSDQKSLWARSYERPIGDALALQSDIASAVAREIGLRLVSNPAARSVVVKPEAQEAYLKGAYFAGQWRLEEATAAFERAVAIDPNHAAAYAGLARAYYFRAFFGEVASGEAFSQMRRAAARALERDETSAEAHGLMALVNVHYDWDWTAAEREFARALELSPSNAQVHHDYAHFLLAVGRRAESIAETKRARDLDPANPMLTTCTGWHSLFDKRFGEAKSYAAEAQMMMPSFWAQVVTGWAYLGEGRLDSAVIAMRSAASLSKHLPFADAALAHALAKSGKTAEARQLLESLLQRSLRGYVSAYDIAIVYAGLGENDHAIDWLRKAMGERSMFVVHLTWDARLDGLRQDPRFTDLVKQLAVPPAVTTRKSTPVA